MRAAAASWRTGSTPTTTSFCARGRCSRPEALRQPAVQHEPAAPWRPCGLGPRQQPACRGPAERITEPAFRARITRTTRRRTPPGACAGGQPRATAPVCSTGAVRRATLWGVRSDDPVLPSPLPACSAMFGDVGHGAIILLTGIVLRRKIGAFTYLFCWPVHRPCSSAGCTAVCSGVEHWLHPLDRTDVRSDLHAQRRPGLGGRIPLTLGSAIAITNRLLSGDHTGALFGHGGLFSLILYLALLGGLINLAQGGGFPLAVTMIVVVTLLLLIGHRWYSVEYAPYGERVSPR